MQALAFWKAVAVDKSNFLEGLIGLLAEHQIRYCVIGGQGVNAYAEPLVSLDLDLVVAVDQMDAVGNLLASRYQLERFPYSLNVSEPDSRLRVQIQTDPRYFDFPSRSAQQEVLGLRVPVAAVEDVLNGKIWAVQDPQRRASKRRKDLLDIERLIEAHPRLRSHVPPEIIARLDVTP
jgi:hypothetical protein